MNRTVKSIVQGLYTIALIPVGLLMAGVDLGIDREDFFIVLVFPPLFVGLGISIWFATPVRQKVMRIFVWVLMLWSLCSWGLMVLMQRASGKAILNFLRLPLLVLPLALLVISEWRYSRPDAAHRTVNTIQRDMEKRELQRNMLIWLAVTSSLVLLWALFRHIL